MQSPLRNNTHHWSAITLGVMAIVLFTLLPHHTLAKEDHYRARSLVEQGEVLPLEQVLRRVNPNNDMRLLEAELEFEDGRWIYEFELIDNTGRVHELEVDARDGTTLEEEIEEDHSYKEKR